MSGTTKLYYGPGACSRVTLVALEEIGLDYEAVRLDFGNKEWFRSINPDARVPTLLMGGETLTQNAAILFYLAQRYPEAQLLPKVDDLGINPGLADLVWCSSSLHIMRRQVLVPGSFTTGDPEVVRDKGVESWRPVLARIADRLSQQKWWYGDRWSIVDAYVNWAYTGSADLNIAMLEERLELDRYPSLREHDERLRARPSFVRALERERSGIMAVNPFS